MASSARATHISGGEIYYKHLTGNQYLITLVVYRDCAGINLDNSYDLNIASPCGNKTLTVSTPGGVEISQLCGHELPNSTCNGGGLPGIQQYIYTGTVSLPPCNSWTISWTQPYRNGAIANLVAPGNKQVYIQAVLNNVAGPDNDSPHFNNTAIPYVCASYPITYSYGAVDPDGDSLSIVGVTQPSSGTVVINPDRSVTYNKAAVTPPGTYAFGYTISDGHGGTATANVTITLNLNPIN